MNKQRTVLKRKGQEGRKRSEVRRGCDRGRGGLIHIMKKEKKKATRKGEDEKILFVGNEEKEESLK